MSISNADLCRTRLIQDLLDWGPEVTPDKDGVLHYDDEGIPTAIETDDTFKVTAHYPNGEKEVFESVTPAARVKQVARSIVDRHTDISASVARTIRAEGLPEGVDILKVFGDGRCHLRIDVTAEKRQAILQALKEALHV